MNKHLMGQMRSHRFFWFLSAYLLGIGILIALVLATEFLPTFIGGATRQSMLDIFTFGRNLFWSAGILLILASGLLVPISALGAIAGERDQRTLDLLKVTALRPWDIVGGKMLSVCLTGLLFISAPLPIIMTGFWLGGVSVTEVAILLIVVVVTMILSCSWALFFSAMVRKTLNAVLIYYILNLISVPILLVATVIVGSTYDSLTYSQRLGTTPSFFLATVFQYGWVILCGFHPIYAAVVSQLLGMEQTRWFLLHFDITRYDPLTDRFSTMGTAYLPSPWILYVIFSLITSAFLLWQATKRTGKLES
ncbi:MAG: hypothetical protein P1S60_13395 [Anaerolineae bacterium]|nr:hypothetical protein [Anaerolineae bacterium]